MATAAEEDEEEYRTTDVSLLLPLRFTPPQLIPPSPTPRSSAVHCLSDLGGVSWIAYAAGPLVVLSPLTPHAFFRQVLELQEPVNAVSWFPVVPSNGEIAVAAGTSVFFFSPVSSSDQSGSFTWNQTDTIEVNSTVEAIAWTATGDALITAGLEVIQWLRKSSSWEIEWRSDVQFPQTLLSATASSQGPVATASLSHTHVLLFVTDGKGGQRKFELPHPRGVVMIQWRPQSRRHFSFRRDVLLTCSVDGTVRLWSDCGNSKSRDIRNVRNYRSFHVVAAVEINSCLGGSLGSNISLMWAVDTGGVIARDKVKGFNLAENDDDDDDMHQVVGTCDWLMSTGPGSSVSFWAVHCLDDISPGRYPRVSLWKRQQITDHEFTKEFAKSGSLLVEARVCRKSLSGPPFICYLVQMFPNCKIVCSKLYNPSLESGNTHSDAGGSSAKEERCLSCISSEALNQVGHNGRIRQVCIYPYNLESNFSVSLDSDGVLLFWSLSVSSSGLFYNLHTSSVPAWDFIGRVDLNNGVSTGSKFSCLNWAPSLQNGKPFLLLGSENKIDCFVVRIPGEGENERFISQSIFTIPFDESDHGEGPPDDIFTIPLSCDDQSVLHNCFLVLCVWKQKTFHTLSLKVNLRCQTQNGSAYTEGGYYEVSFDGDVYHATVSSWSSKSFSTCQDGYQITSLSYALPNALMFPTRSYHIITGCSDGSVKLWILGVMNSNLQSDKESPIWELVGSFIANNGYIGSVSLSDCGTRIATLSSTTPTGASSCIDIWEPICITGGTSGMFLLEHTITTLKSPVIHFSWFSIGNGQLLLGVSLEKEIRVYSQRMPDRDQLWWENAKKTCFWDCIAVCTSCYEINFFLWGPKASLVLVHDNHLSVHTQWICKSDGQNYASSDTCGRIIKENLEKKKNLYNIVDLSGSLGGPFLLYHPRSLMHFLYSGKWKRAQEILQHILHSSNTAENCSRVPEIQLSKYFTDVAPTDVSNNASLQWGMNSMSSFVSSSQFSSNTLDYRGDIGNSNFFTTTERKRDVTVLLSDALTKCSEISEIERSQIIVIYDILGEISDPSRSSPYKSLDDAGRMFWVSVQFQRRYHVLKSGDSSNEQGWRVNSALIAWASQSECKDDLLSCTLSSEASWLEMQTLGIGFWYNDVAQLRTKMEKLARMQYLKRKDPKECTLLYVALNRIQVLAGLFKISKDEKDKVLYTFLCRNFQEEKNKAAALKNAYVLMGRHQLELAIAFFLLGGDISSAVSICAKNYNDEQLALVICRLQDGNNTTGMLERDLISNVLLPNAIDKGDRWLASFFEWKLGNYSQSVKRFFENFIRVGSDERFRSLHASSVDPLIGRYCAILASKNNFKISFGEVRALRLSKALTALTASALNRYGLPLEALECVSLASSIESREQIISSSNEDHTIFQEFINPSSDAVLYSWMSKIAASHVMCTFKLMMATKYLSKYMCDNAPFMLCNLPSNGEIDSYSNIISDARIEELYRELKTSLSVFEKKFALQPDDLIDMVSLFLCNKGMLFVAHLLFGSDSLSADKLSTVHAILLKTNKDICSVLSNYVISCGFINSSLRMSRYRLDASNDDYTMKYHMPYLKMLLKLGRSFLKSFDSGNCPKIFCILDLLEFTLEFAISWLIEDMKGLVILYKPILDIISHGRHFDLATTAETLMESLQRKISEESLDITEVVYNERNVASTLALTDDEKWFIISTCLWIHLSNIMKKSFVDLTDLELKFAHALITSAEFIRSSFVKQLAFYITRKTFDNSDSNALIWLNNQSYQQVDNQILLPNNGDKGSLINLLWEMSVRPHDICTALVNEEVSCFPYRGNKLYASWKYVDRILETKGNQSGDDDKESNSCFENPREVIKRSGELLEAICFNSIDEQQVAVTSNKKGLIFFNYTNQQHRHIKSDHIWSESEWPVNGWSGSEGSSGIAQSSNSYTQLGFGRAAMAKPGREITGGGAFGVPGYAGIGAAASFAWGGQHDDFYAYNDIPASIENVQSCALSRHPLRNLLLVGSSNTHVYLWEFGEERALATYGVLPAAPPPYPLASISSVGFDTYGHRFATAASNGAVSTWQLEVGGRSNVHPIDSSLCFDNHASDVAFMSASGSVVATSGYNTNNANVLVWDTLAPPATCQATVICHEGGAQSLAVLNNNDIGNGSVVSPYIVTGGKSGDIGLHDFRFITTSKTKHKSSAMHDRNNNSGMVWYMPKAHLGSIAKIATIPNTNMFLTGGKDGDVKLWDSKKSELVYQWPRLHDRHTFFQSNSKVFGGVIRAAVTDIQVMSHGFLTCGGDGSVKLIRFK